jgi:hypothetical protein
MSIFTCARCGGFADADDGCKEVGDRLVCVDCVNDATVPPTFPNDCCATEASCSCFDFRAAMHRKAPDDERDRAVAERSAARSEPSTAGWLPISTAPKDGSLFLAACPYLYKQTEERWDVHAIRIDENYDPPQLDDDCYQGWDLDAYTHWQPLPPAPSQEGASEGEGQT